MNVFGLVFKIQGKIAEFGSVRGTQICSSRLYQCVREEVLPEGSLVWSFLGLSLLPLLKLVLLVVCFRYENVDFGVGSFSWQTSMIHTTARGGPWDPKMQRGWDDVAAGAELVPPNEGGERAGEGG